MDKSTEATGEKKILVFFTNGKRATFREEEVQFRTGASAPWARELDKCAGQSIVNWDNVCFIRFGTGDDD